MKLTKNKLSSRALAVKQARQTVQKTLKLFEGMDIFTCNRTAELQAVAVILVCAESDIWDAYSKFKPSPVT